MHRILVCRDDVHRARLTEYYKREIRPSLTRMGHNVQLTTCARALKRLENWSPDILLMFVPRKESPCWEIARCARQARNRDSPSPLILMIIAWGPDDSRDNPAYYTDPEYAALYDDYHATFGEGPEIARWVEGFLSGQQSE
jgi:CheY-like chemotaxis protein